MVNNTEEFVCSQIALEEEAEIGQGNICNAWGNLTHSDKCSQEIKWHKEWQIAKGE